MEMNTTHLQVLQIGEHYHVQVENSQGMLDRVALTSNEWQFALRCMTASAPFYPYFDDTNYLVQIMSNGMKIKHVDQGQIVETRIYLFPMHIVAERYPGQCIWDKYDCAALKTGWNSNSL